jgi:ankyrin repeat protein
MYVYGNSCKALQYLQEAIKNRDPKVCTTINTNMSWSISEYMKCIGEFPNTPEWSEGCQNMKKRIGENSTLGGNFSYFLIAGKCLNEKNVNIVFPGSIHGKYNNYLSTESYTAPVWFDRLRGLTKENFDYLKKIWADPNTVDSLGRTALILEIQERLYLNDYLIHNFDSMSKEQQPMASKKAVETAKLLIEFWVDPSIQDSLGKSAIDYASQIKNEIFRKTMLEVLWTALRE